MSNYIDLYRAQIDYLTITSWEDSIAHYWNKTGRGSEFTGSTEKSFRGYLGKMHWHPRGSLFVGTGTQKDMSHYMIQISGNLAEEMKTDVFNQRLAYQIMCTRVDLQITIPEPEGWSQVALFNRIHRSKKTPGWASSTDAVAGRLESVYIGSWHSDRLSTVYVKLTAGNERLLRLETRYKKDRANALLPQLAKGELPDNFLRHELQSVLKDRKLSVAFEPHLLGGQSVSATVRLKQKEDKTAEWLLEKVLPTFARIVLDHDHDGTVLESYQRIIDKKMDMKK